MGSNLRLFASNDFTGHYPVGSALIVVAVNEDEALKLAKDKCAENKLVFDGTLIEIDLCASGSYMLVDGDY